MFIGHVKASWLIISNGNKTRNHVTNDIGFCVLSKLLHQVVSVLKINIEKALEISFSIVLEPFTKI